MNMKIEDLKIDRNLNTENAFEKGYLHRTDILIDPKHPEWNMDDVMKWVDQGFELGAPAVDDERYVGVYEKTEAGDDDQPVDLLDNEPDSSTD